MKRAFGLVTAVCLIILIGFPTVIAIMLKSPIEVGDDTGMYMKLLDHRTGKVISMTVEQYLVGVVSAEMPITFEPEALKAQAVAARTYAMKRIEEGKKKKFPEHRGADLCSNPSHCQAWNSKETLMNSWGITSYMSNLKKVTNAVEETQGLVITYNGQLIDAVYHSSCGGFTEDSGNVWVSQVPYLVAVECNYEQANNKLKETKTWSASSLKSIFGIGQWVVAASASADVMNKAKMADPSMVQVIDATDSDRARYVSIFGTLIDAKVVRQKLGLKSTKIQVNNLPGSVEFTTYGYGHGVGMCQYGANGMASAGMTFDQILHHYYTGVQISVAVAGK